MATQLPVGPKPFDEDDLKYVVDCLSLEAEKAEDVLRGGALSDDQMTWDWPGFKPLVEDSKHYQVLTVRKGSGKQVTADLWEQSKRTGTINGISPTFTFVTVSDSITDPKDAFRSLLCTLISEISNYVVRVPAEEMADSGIFGEEFVRKYIDREYHQQVSQQLGSESESEESDEIEVLLELLEALKHCDFEFVEQNIFVFDGIRRVLEEASSGYWEGFRAVLENTLWAKMKLYTLFVEEED
ncbi:hypothetical protein GQX73_g9447 [Xylaria multiplex]|uniref:Uncharacterized protein n=1 Tax=Xylaria multiplex TaxID=323545 RepID=A0A7C8II88_9PEZI|nr:hypothetical protein GQX73_g9447 [Xylaria multiplex]